MGTLLRRSWTVRGDAELDSSGLVKWDSGGDCSLPWLETSLLCDDEILLGESSSVFVGVIWS